MALVRNLQTGLTYATIGAAKDALPQPLDQDYALIVEDSDTYLEPTIIFNQWQDAGFTLTIKAAAGQAPRMETTSSRCFWLESLANATKFFDLKGKGRYKNALRDRQGKPKS